MLYDEEKDYVMRMIREVSRVLFSIRWLKPLLRGTIRMEDG